MNIHSFTKQTFFNVHAKHIQTIDFFIDNYID